MKQQPKANETQRKQQNRQLQELQSKQAKSVKPLQKRAGVGYRCAISEDIAHTTEGCHGGNGCDQRADPQLCHQKSVEGPHKAAYYNRRKQTCHTAEPGADQRGDNGRQRHGHAQRQVNFAGNQQKGHADGRNAVHTKIRQQFIDVICAGKVGHKPDAIAQDQDEDQDDIVLRKQLFTLFHSPALLSLRI